jgi:two-component system CheB/CheR fusion protein
MSAGPTAAKRNAVKKVHAGEPRDSDEEDRRRLARELHDDIGQRLALLADDAASLRQELHLDDGANRRRLDNLVQQARQLGEDLRRISHALHPAILEDLGLIPALRLLIEDFTQRTGLPAAFSHFNIPADLPAIVSTALYRISQEALRNVWKHAGHASVQLILRAAGGEIVLVITDSGLGFETAATSGLGLTSIRERVQLAGGTLRVTSAPGKGTSLQVQIPFPY